MTEDSDVMIVPMLDVLRYERLEDPYYAVAKRFSLMA